MSGFKIESIHAFIAVDPSDGDEGVIGVQSRDGWIPLVAADVTRLEQLRPMALEIARNAKHEIKLVRFDRRTDLEVIKP